MSGRHGIWTLSALGLVVLQASITASSLASPQRQPGESASSQQNGLRSDKSDEASYEKIVNDFIRFDIGQVRDPVAAEHIKARFSSMRSEDSVPALVRGLNASTRLRASCPITALSGKLRSIASSSKNPDVGTFILQNLERNNVGPYTFHLNSVFDAAENQVARTMGNGLAEQQFKRRAEEGLQRLAFTPGLKITDIPERDAAEVSARTAAREKRRVEIKKGAAPSSDESGATAPAADMSRLGMAELVDRLSERGVQSKILVELSRRAAAGEEQNVLDATDSIVQCLTNGDDLARESAARLLGLVRSQRAVPTLIDALDDKSPKVRSAAATALARTTRQLFGPNDDASPEERLIAIHRWREWWSRQSKNTPTPMPG
jgi:hypothetical protein